MRTAMKRQYERDVSQADVLIKLRQLLASKDPKTMEAVKKAQQAILNLKALTPGTVHVDSVLTNLSIRYSNPTFVGTRLAPVVKVNKPSGKFYKYSKRDRMGTPDASVGQRSMPNEISENRTLGSYSTDPYALVDFLDDRLARLADAPLDEMGELVVAVNDVHDLLEEIRIATMLTTAGNYAGNTEALTGGDKWDDPSSDPVGQIQDAVDSMWDAPGANSLRAITSPEVISKLRRHPQVVDQFKYTNSKNVSIADLAQFFGLDEILVGRARKDVANEGQTASYDRVWGKHFIIGKVNDSPGTRSGTFAATWRWGEKITSQWYDPMPGVSGGYYAKVGLEESHDIVAPDLGYLFENVIS